jgi:hypothetical protein
MISMTYIKKDFELRSASNHHSMTATTSSSTAVTVEEPSRDELVQIFAQRFPSLSQQRVGVVFDEYLRLGHLDVGCDELTGEWRVDLSGKRTRQ